jgi:hypothetical protein
LTSFITASFVLNSVSLHHYTPLIPQLQKPEYAPPALNPELSAMGTSGGKLKQGECNAHAGLQRANRALRALSECTQLLVRAESEQELPDKICWTNHIAVSKYLTE